jgi:hypothetical protein
MRWVVEDIDGFAARYVRAKHMGIDEFVEETLEIADEPPPLTSHGAVDSGAVAHARVRIETRRWLAERMAPQRYGVRQSVDVSNTDGTLQVDEATRGARVAQLLAIAQARKSEGGEDSGQ